MDGAVRSPELPTGVTVELPGRGATFYRDVPGPPGAPTVVLIHGWTATADLNWFRCYGELAEHYRILAPDLRGHGRGLRTLAPFRLEDCADDIAALLDVVGVTSASVVGYSMGGTVAQLFWRRHRQRMDALVLAATAAVFATTRDERLRFGGLSGLGTLARLAPERALDHLSERFFLSRKRQSWDPWAVNELAQHDWRLVLQAGGRLGRFDSRPWLARIDTPTAVIMTTADSVVAPVRQRALADALADPVRFELDGDHDACFRLDHFASTIVDALDHLGVARVSPAHNGDQGQSGS
jgi:3-oxoadipate enol-lactonase